MWRTTIQLLEPLVCQCMPFFSSYLNKYHVEPIQCRFFIFWAPSCVRTYLWLQVKRILGRHLHVKAHPILLKSIYPSRSIVGNLRVITNWFDSPNVVWRWNPLCRKWTKRVKFKVDFFLVYLKAVVIIEFGITKHHCYLILLQYCPV